MSQEIKDFIKNRELLKKNHIYKDSYEHDNCGVGLVAAINGESRRDIVEKGVEALKAVFHRGAVDADGKTGDGAGIMLEVSHSFFSKQVTKTGHLAEQDNLLGVGMIFLPKRDFGAQEKCRAIVEYEIIKAGMSLYGWRQVPVNTEIIGEKANFTKPEIEQIIFTPKDSRENIEKKLYLTRRRIENKIKALNINDFYICSLSTETIVYKGMFLAEQLSEFYPDLLDPDFKSKFAIYHQRYSTNTFPTWSREGHKELAETLHKRGGSLEFSELEAAGELCGRALQGDVQRIKLLLDLGCSPNAADYDKRTVMHVAASEGHKNIVADLLGRKANVSQAPISAGDVPMTYADVSHARALLGYSPQVSLASGVRRFLQWYSAYYGVALPTEMAPTRREGAELREKYDIAGKGAGAGAGGGGGAKRKLRSKNGEKRRLARHMQAGASDAGS